MGIEGGAGPSLETSVQLMEVVLSMIFSHQLTLRAAPYLAYMFRGSRGWSHPLVVEEDLPISRLAELFAQHHRVNPIVVVDKSRKLKGGIIVSKPAGMFVYEGAKYNKKTTDKNWNRVKF